MARYGRDYGWTRGGYDAGFRNPSDRSYYGQGGGGSFRRPGYDRGYEGGGWGMGGLYDSITHGAGERGYARDHRGGSRYDAGFYRRGYGAERGERWGGSGAQRGYDRSFGRGRIDRQRYDRGWS